MTECESSASSKEPGPADLALFFQAHGEHVIAAGRKLVLAVGLAILVATGCAPRSSPPPAPPIVASGASTATAGTTGLSSRTATPMQPLPVATPTATPTTVSLTAVGGQLYVRRGSGSDFDPLAALLEGRSAPAAGRDILGEWLYIPIPGQTVRFGWVSTLTPYSAVQGRIMDLPVVDSDLAVPAYFRNCSTHHMLVQPSGVILPPGDQFPENIVRFDPGEYSIHDYDVVKHPEVEVVDLREGQQHDIIAWHTAGQHKCPEP